MSFVIKLAGKNIEINHRYEYIKELCRDYMTDEEAELSVSVTDEDILAEVAVSEGLFGCEICEATCIHREITNSLVKYGIILIHSAVIAVDGAAYVFAAKSGVGKSTHIGLWQSLFGDRAVVLNGDKPMFGFEGDVLMAYGTPWRGKEQLGQNISMPVGGFCFIERDDENIIEKADSTVTVDRLFHQVLLPACPSDLDIFMKVLNKIIKAIPFYTLKCNMEPRAARVAYEAMKTEVII